MCIFWIDGLSSENCNTSKIIRHIYIFDKPARIYLKYIFLNKVMTLETFIPVHCGQSPLSIVPAR